MQFIVTRHTLETNLSYLGGTFLMCRYVWASGILAAGQSSTMTGTYAGQVNKPKALKLYCSSCCTALRGCLCVLLFIVKDGLLWPGIFHRVHLENCPPSSVCTPMYYLYTPDRFSFQFCMSGFLELQLHPWQRMFLTRACGRCCLMCHTSQS